MDWTRRGCVRRQTSSRRSSNDPCNCVSTAAVLHWVGRGFPRTVRGTPWCPTATYLKPILRKNTIKACLTRCHRFFFSSTQGDWLSVVAFRLRRFGTQETV